MRLTRLHLSTYPQNLLRPQNSGSYLTGTRSGLITREGHGFSRAEKPLIRSGFSR